MHNAEDDECPCETCSPREPVNWIERVGRTEEDYRRALVYRPEMLERVLAIFRGEKKRLGLES